MDYAACYVVYVDHNACNDRLFTKDDEDLLLQSHLEELHLDDGKRVAGLAIDKSANKLLHENIGTLLQTFGGGMRLCRDECQTKGEGMLTYCSIRM